MDLKINNDCFSIWHWFTFITETVCLLLGTNRIFKYKWDAGHQPWRSGFDPSQSIEICPGRSANETGLPPNTSVFPCQYHSTHTPSSHLPTYCCHYEDIQANHGNLPKAILFRKSEIGYKNTSNFFFFLSFNPYPTAFPYGNGMVLHFYQQQESSTTKTVHKVINKGLKAYV